MTCFLLTNEWQCMPKITVGPPFGIVLAGCAPLYIHNHTLVSRPARFKTQVYDCVYVDIGPQRFQEQRKRRSSGKLCDCFDSCFNFFYCYTKDNSELFFWVATPTFKENTAACLWTSNVSCQDCGDIMWPKIDRYTPKNFTETSLRPPQIMTLSSCGFNLKKRCILISLIAKEAKLEFKRTQQNVVSQLGGHNLAHTDLIGHAHYLKIVHPLKSLESTSLHFSQTSVKLFSYSEPF